MTLRRISLACAVFGLAGCGGYERPQPQLDPPKATEPERGPELKQTPGGRIVKVGSRPEGVAIDPRSGLVAVAVRSPARLVLVDVRTGRVRHTVPLPGHARHVGLLRPGGPFLVPAEDVNRLVEVDPQTGVTRSTRVGEYPHDATAVSDRIFTADEFGSTMSIVRDGRRVGQVPVDAQPGNVVATGEKVAVISVRSYTVELYDATRDSPRGGGSQNAGLGPSHAALGPRGRLAITDTRGKSLVVYDTRPELRFFSRLALGGTPVGIAADARRGRIWVALSERNRALPIDLTGKEPEVGQAVNTIRSPYSLAVDPASGRLAIASAADGTLQLVDP